MANLQEILGDALRRNPFLLVAFSFLLYLVLVGFLGGLVFMGLELSTGLTLASAQTELLNGAGPDSTAAGVFRSAQGANQLIGYGLSALLIAWLLGNPPRELSIERSPNPAFLILGMGIMVASVPLVQVMIVRPEWLGTGEFIQGLIDQEAQSEKLLVSLFVNPSPQNFLANLLIFAALPAFCEEAFFRGILQSNLQKKLGPHGGILLAAALFSFIHFQFLGFFSRWLLGMLLGYMVYYSRSLWPAIFAHFCFNATSVAGAYFYPELAQTDYQFQGTPLLVALLLVLGLGYLYLRLGKRTLAQPIEDDYT